MNYDFDEFFVSPSSNNADVYADYESYVEFKVNSRIGRDVGVSFSDYLAEKNSPMLFRRADNSDFQLQLMWLSRVRKITNLFVSFGDLPDYEPIDRDYLSYVAGLNSDETAILSIAKILHERGVVLMYYNAFPGMKVDGACFRSVRGNPVIVMSLRYPRVDYFWFTLMHELSHVLLHSENLDNGVFDDFDVNQESLIERQANKEAASFLIPRSIWRTCRAKTTLKEPDLMEFSSRHSIHPAIVAGRIRSDLNRYDIFSDIVNKVDVRVLING